MKRLSFKSRYIEPILDGTKTQTLRRYSTTLPQAGEPVSFRCRQDQPAFATARVVAVDGPLTLDDLDEADAAVNGYENLESFLDDVRVLYGSAGLARVSFVLVGQTPGRR